MSLNKDLNCVKMNQKGVYAARSPGTSTKGTSWRAPYVPSSADSDRASPSASSMYAKACGLGPHNNAFFRYVLNSSLFLQKMKQVRT